MSDHEHSANVHKNLDKSTRWAADRTLWAADRTFIAWLRTAISLIGFGMAIGKTGDVLEEQGLYTDPNRGLQIVGVGFITLAVIGLIGALIQNYRIEKRIENEGYGRVEPTPLGLTMGILVVLVGCIGGFYMFLG